MLTLYVDGPRWRAHLERVVASHPGIVPVAKGNGYGLGNRRLAEVAQELGADTVAVGTYAEVADVSVDVEGAIDLRRFYGIDDSGRAGFGDVRLVVTLSGPAGEERYRELAAAVDEHCPVLDLFRNPTPVTVEHVTA